MKYAWIDGQSGSCPVALMCDVLQVSKSGFYAWRGRPASPRALRHQRICAAIREVHNDSHGIYGSVKIAQALGKRPDLESACRNTAATAMREMGLESRVGAKFKPTTTRANPAHPVAPNHLDRDFTAEAPNRKWVTDITYLPAASGWVYLAVVLDLFSRKVVGWALSTSLATELVAKALRNAIESRRPEGHRLLHHSDRGCQYTSQDYQQTLAALGIQCSMSRTGSCYDNAVMERFFWSLKHEWTSHQQFQNLEDARLSVFQYIETFYNNQRSHQTLNYLTPIQFEAVNQQANAA